MKLSGVLGSVVNFINYFIKGLSKTSKWLQKNIFSVYFENIYIF